MRRDDLLARVQRTAALVCLVMAIAALALAGWAAAAAVLGGGVLAGVSFVLIKGGILDLTSFVDERPRDPSRRPNAGFAAVKLAGRYALLGFLAYVMIARLRLHPIGLFAGASSVVAAAAIEAGRLLRKNR